MYTALKRFVLSKHRALAALGACLIAGCVSSTETAKGPYVTQSSDGGNTAVIRQQPVRPSIVIPVDGPETCDEQLQDICDALLNYYASKRHLPEKLEDLVPFAIEGRQLRFNCPDSGKPYVFDKDGPMLNQSMWLTTPSGKPVQMNQPSATGRLIIYDAVAAHKGQRWCIAFGRDIRGNGMRADPCKIPDQSLIQALNAAHGTPPGQ